MCSFCKIHVVPYSTNEVGHDGFAVFTLMTYFCKYNFYQNRVLYGTILQELQIFQQVVLA